MLAIHIQKAGLDHSSLLSCFNLRWIKKFEVDPEALSQPDEVDDDETKGSGATTAGAHSICFSDLCDKLKACSMLPHPYAEKPTMDTFDIRDWQFIAMKYGSCSTGGWHIGRLEGLDDESDASNIINVCFDFSDGKLGLFEFHHLDDMLVPPLDPTASYPRGTWLIIDEQAFVAPTSEAGLVNPTRIANIGRPQKRRKKHRSELHR